MQVAYPLVSEQIGGGNRSLLTLWSALRGQVQATAVAPRFGPMSSACTTAGVQYRVIPADGPSRQHPVTTLRRWLEWRRLLWEGEIQIVHSNGTEAARPAALPAWTRRCVHVCHVRFPSPPEDIRWSFRGLPKPDAFVFNSEALRREMARHVARACPASLQRVIHNGVDLTRFRPSYAPKSMPVVGIVANLAPVKGHPDFLMMARLLERAGVRADYWIVGGDIHGSGYGQKLETLCRELELSQRVRFLGHRDDVPEIIREMDVLVCASHQETFGRCLIEAMACAKPVVATRVGGIPEVVDDHVTGLLVPPASPGALAEAVGVLLRTPARRRQMGEAGLARVRARFSAEAHANAVMRLYEQLVCERRGE